MNRCFLILWILNTDTYHLKNPFAHFIRQIDSNGKIDESRVIKVVY